MVEQICFETLFYLLVLTNGIKWILISEISILTWCSAKSCSLALIKPSEKSIYNIYDPQGSTILNRFRLRFSHLREHKFRNNFADTVNPLCSCVLETESAHHFFLRCQNYVSFRTALMNELSSINCEIVSLRPSTLPEAILYGDNMLNDNSYHRMLTATINYIKNTQRFEQGLF